MTVFLIEAPFPTFSDTNGKPLDNGKIWIGVVDQNPKQYPQPVFWDEALTIPAVQPIRTSGGYPVRDGTPSRIYCDDIFSITVENRQGGLVYSALNGTTTDVVNTGWGGQTFTADGREGPYPLDYITPDPRAMALVLDGVWQEYETDYGFVIMPSAPSGYGVQIVGYPAPADPIRIRVLFTADVAGTGASINGDIAQFATRQALVDFMAAGGVVFPGFAVMAAGLTYIGQALATELPGLPGLVPVDATPGHYGAVGDGVANDAAGMTAAIIAGRPLDWGGGTYRYTTAIAATAPVLQWTGQGATVIFDGPAATLNCLNVTVPLGAEAAVFGIVFDGGNKGARAVVFSSAALIADARSLWPEIELTNVTGQNCRMSTDLGTNAAGIMVAGGWQSVAAQGCRVRNVFMSAAVAFLSTQAVNGLSTFFIGSAFPMRVAVEDFEAENIWCEGKIGTQQEADGISIFQEVGVAQPSGDSLSLTNVRLINTGNRAIKLHSATRAIISGVHVRQQGSVLPFTGSMRASHIDAQQGGAIISDVDALFDGVWPPVLIANYVEQDSTARNGGITSNIKAYFTPTTLGSTQLFRHRNDNITTNGDADVIFSNVVCVGQILNVLRMGARLNGVHKVILDNVLAESTGEWVAFQAPGTTASLTLIASNCMQQGAAVALASGVDPDWSINAIGCSGFSDTAFIALSADRQITIGGALVAPLDFATRAGLVAWIAAGGVIPAGQTATAGGLTYAGQALATELPGLPGVIPVNATPGHYGAVGDNTADDRAALIAAWTANRPGLDHGSATYRITDEIVQVFTTPLRWKSAGATIRLDRATSKGYAVYLQIPAGRNVIDGVFTVDANTKAYVALRIANATVPVVFPTDWVDLIADDLCGMNAYRAGLTYSNGDGLLIGGAMNVVSLQRARAINCVMAIGADVFGSQGIAGITINRDNTNGLSVRALFMGDCYVDTVYSEAPAVDYDQDGIRVFQYYDGAGNMPQDCFAVVGGVVRNSRNRSLKIQSQWVDLRSFRSYKDATIDIGSAGVTRNSDIDFQVGGGFADSIQLQYDGFVAAEAIRYTETETPGKKTNGMVINGIKGAVSSASTIPLLLAIFASSGVNEFTASISNVHIAGNVGTVLRTQAANTATTAYVSMKDVFAQITTGGYLSTGTGLLVIDMENIVNNGPAAVPLIVTAGATLTSKTITARGLAVGFNDQTETDVSSYTSYLKKGTNARLWNPGGSVRAILESTGNTFLDIVAGIAGSSRLNFGDTDAEAPGEIRYTHGTDTMAILVGGSSRVSVTASQATVSVPLFQSPPGPFANDAGAAVGGVAIGGLYRVTGGTVAWRQV